MTTENLLRDSLHAAAGTIEAEPPELSTLTAEPARDARPRRRRTVTLAAAAVALSASTAVAVTTRSADPVVPEALTEQIDRHISEADCMSPAEAETFVRDTLDRLGHPDWTVDVADPDAACVRAGLDASTSTVILQEGWNGADKDVMSALPSLLLEDCYSWDQAVDLVQERTAGLPGGPATITRSESIPIPEWDEDLYTSHHQQGCTVLGGSGANGSGTPWVALVPPTT